MIDENIQITISKNLYNKLRIFGIIDDSGVRSDNVGKSDYSKHIIQAWSIIKEYELNYWDGDIVKRVLRTKEDNPRKMDYEKIIHNAKERIRQIEIENKIKGEEEKEVEDILSNL